MKNISIRHSVIIIVSAIVFASCSGNGASGNGGSSADSSASSAGGENPSDTSSGKKGIGSSASTDTSGTGAPMTVRGADSMQGSVGNDTSRRDTSRHKKSNGRAGVSGSSRTGSDTGKIH